MTNSQKEIITILVNKGDKLLHKPRQKIVFTGKHAADDLLNNIKDYPHAYVLACIMDRQINAERAWLIPYWISEKIGSFEFLQLFNLSLDKITQLFKTNAFHRFNEQMADNFYLAIKKIHSDYAGNAAKIWNDRPPSAAIVKRFLEFKGVGIKIATMAVNILARDFKISMKDRICIDISPDTHVKRVFKRLGFILADASNDELIYCARELNPEYPGIFDLSCWEIGRAYCRPTNPSCGKCYLNRYCPKLYRK
jgi:endonuclease III